MVGKKPSVKADMAIYSQAVEVCGRCMSESLILGHNLDSVLVTLWSVFVNPVTYAKYKQVCMIDVILRHIAAYI